MRHKSELFAVVATIPANDTQAPSQPVLVSSQDTPGTAFLIAGILVVNPIVRTVTIWRKPADDNDKLVFEWQSPRISEEYWQSQQGDFETVALPLAPILQAREQNWDMASRELFPGARVCQLISDQLARELHFGFKIPVGNARSATSGPCAGQPLELPASLLHGLKPASA